MRSPSDRPHSDSAPTSPNDVLDSWKEIARYLNRDIRTLRRWEQDRGLPIHRIPGGSKPAVYALRSELDAWWKSRAEETSRPSSRNRNVSPERASPSVAVLPFINLSANPDDEYFSDGLTDEIIGALARLPGLRVTARTSAFALRGASLDVRQIAKQLNVRAILEGSVRRSGDRIRVTAQLINAEDGFHIWSENYECQMTDIMDVQDRIAQGIARSTRTGLKGVGSLVRRSTDNWEAYNAWLKGRYCFYQQTPEAMAQSRQFFESAISLDPHYPDAYVGLGEHYLQIAFYGFVPPRQAASQGESAIRRALELDESIGPAHAALGMFRGVHDFDWPEAERAFLRAVELSPSAPDVHNRYAWGLLVPLQRLDEAETELALALELDPLSAYSHCQLGQLCMFRRDYVRAAAHIRSAITLDDNNWVAHWLHGMIAWLGGDADEGIRSCEKAKQMYGSGFMVAGAMAALYGLTGRTQQARKVLSGLRDAARRTHVSALGMAWAFMGLGELDSVFEWLNKAIEERDPQVVHLSTKPIYDAIREDARFAELLRKMNLANGRSV